MVFSDEIISDFAETVPYCSPPSLEVRIRLLSPVVLSLYEACFSLHCDNELLR